jgi:hypothetical protein
MFTHNFGLIFVAIVAVVVGAVAIARPSADANIGISSKTYPFAAKCPMIDWPYGCRWHPESESNTRQLSARMAKRAHLHASFLDKLISNF